MIMQNNFRKALTGLVVAGALFLPGCKYEFKEPVRENYNHNSAALSKSHHMRVIDEDNDGVADMIAEAGVAKFVRDGYKSQRFYTEYALIMTPELRDSATKELHAERDLDYLMDKSFYQKYKESQK